MSLYVYRQVCTVFTKIVQPLLDNFGTMTKQGDQKV